MLQLQQNRAAATSCRNRSHLWSKRENLCIRFGREKSACAASRRRARLVFSKARRASSRDGVGKHDGEGDGECIAKTEAHVTEEDEDDDAAEECDYSRRELELLLYVERGRETRGLDKSTRAGS